MQYIKYNLPLHLLSYWNKLDFFNEKKNTEMNAFFLTRFSLKERINSEIRGQRSIHFVDCTVCPRSLDPFFQ